MDPNSRKSLRSLPSIEALLVHGRCLALIAEYGREAVAHALREAVDFARASFQYGAGGSGADPELLIDAAEQALLKAAQPSLRGVINATGIVLHTNLGRAPLANEAAHALIEVALEYSNVEYDLAQGRRGSRQEHVESLLMQLTDAEAAMVVNNNAAAVMLAVNSLARDGEVVTSRGELIEIGGSFRIPDVIETSEARLAEVGTTNRTRAADFAKAIGPNTRMLLKVHPSNYRVVGFTEAPRREELVALARERGLMSMEDLGSGTLVGLSALGLSAEPTVQEALRAGMDLVTFSGDKLLGGPQAGIICGRAELIGRMKKNPLYRALRVGKLTLAALEATLRLYLDEAKAFERVPVLRILSLDPAELRKRARQLAKKFGKIPRVTADAVETTGFAGGGSLPEDALADWAVALRVEGKSADELHAALRQGEPPIVGRIAEGFVLLHLRTMKRDHFAAVEAAIAHAAT